MKRLFLIFMFFILSANTAYAAALYSQADSNFNKLAMQAYSSGGYTVTHKNKAYIYKAIPITETPSGCKLIAVTREKKGFSYVLYIASIKQGIIYNREIRNPGYWAVENYKICSGKIASIQNTNPAAWDSNISGPGSLKPFIDGVAGRASSTMTASMIIGKYIIAASSHHKVRQPGDSPFFVTVYILKNNKLFSITRVQTY